MSSLQSHLIRPFLWVQRLAQYRATIEATRRMSRWADTYNRMPKGVHTEKFEQGGLTYEWIIPQNADPQRVILYLHGGGFVFPLWYPGKRVCAYLARMTCFRLLAVHYRIAPEHPFPAALEDCAAGYRWLISDGGISPEHIVFLGESAGGNLVVTTLLALREAGDPLPAGAVAICPVLDFSDDRDPSHTPDDLLALPKFVMIQLDAYRAGADPCNPLLSPVYGDLRGLPPLLIQVGEAEMLYPDAKRFAMLAEQAEVTTKLDTWPEMWHFWHLFVPFLPEARQALETITKFVLSVLGAPGQFESL